MRTRERSRDPDQTRPSPPPGDIDSQLTEMAFKYARMEHTMMKNASDIALLTRQITELATVHPAVAKLRVDVTTEYNKHHVTLQEHHVTLAEHQARLDRAENKIPARLRELNAAVVELRERPAPPAPVAPVTHHIGTPHAAAT